MPKAQSPWPQPQGQGAAGGDATAALLLAVSSLVRSQEALIQQRASGPPGNPLQSLVSGSGSDVLPNLPGARGAAALELYRQDFLAHPEMYAKLVRDNAATALDPGLDGAAPHGAFVAFLTRYMAWGRAPRGTMYLAFGIGHALDMMGRGQWHLAEATMSVLLAGLEQSLLDYGRWNLGWLFCHLPDPPWHLLATAPPADPARPYGKLAPASWVVAASAYVKDAAALEELRRRGGRSRADEGGEGFDGGEGGGRANRRATAAAAAKAKAAAQAAAAATSR